MRRSFAIVLLATMLFAAPAAHSARYYTETIASGGPVGAYISLAVDDDGVPHVVYWDFSNFFVMYATRVNGAWSSELIETSVFTGAKTAIAVDSQNIPHMIYNRFGAAGETLRYGHRTGGVWTVEDVDLSGDSVGQGCALAIDAQDRPHVTYHNATNGDLMYGVRDGAWTIEVASPLADIGRNSDLALDGNGRPHVSHTDDNGEGFYSTRESSGWLTENLPGAADDLPTGITLGSSGELFIAFTVTLTTTVQRRIVGNWENVVAGFFPVNFDGSMVTRVDGAPHVLLQDNAVLDLRESRYDPVGDVWSRNYIIENALTSVGLYNDIALDPYGNPVVVYSNETAGDAMFADAGVRLSTGLSGVTWPVGSERTVTWRGVGTVDLLLSTDGGASYSALATGLTGGDSPVGGQYTFTVPHRPSRFCKIKVERQTPYGAGVSDSLFTIETNVSLLSLVVTPPPSQSGNVVSWATDPGPEDLAGYRLERGRGDEWSTLVALTKQTSHHDGEGIVGDRYRLYAVNGLGVDYLLGTSGGGRTPTVTALDVFPNPFTSGELTVQFATGGLGGVGDAVVAVYDVTGRLVRTLATGRYAAGVERVTWGGRDSNGLLLPSGVYFVRSSVGAEINSKKLLIVR